MSSAREVLDLESVCRRFLCFFYASLLSRLINSLFVFDFLLQSEVNIHTNTMPCTITRRSLTSYHFFAYILPPLPYARAHFPPRRRT